MKKLFRGYYPPTEAELDEIWDEGLIVLDTNALLNLFRYTETTRGEFFTVLQAVSEKLWIPNQIALEFQKRRLDVIDDQTKAYNDLDKSIESGKTGVARALQGFRHHPLLDKAYITQLLDDGMGKVATALSKSRDEYNASVVAGGENERVFDKISELYAERVGAPFEQTVLEELYTDGAIRYDAKMPPGYEDRDKPEPDRYGDLILWRQLLKQAQLEKRPALFVTDDGKEDWWRRVKGKTHGPRVELVDEFFDASGRRIHFYAPERFLDFAKKKLGIDVSATSLNEVEEVSRERPSPDTNLLSVERARLQAIQKELDKSLLFPGQLSTPANLHRVMLKLDSAKTHKDEAENELLAIADTLVGLDEGGVRDSILAHRARLEKELTAAKHEFEEAFELFEHATRNHRVLPSAVSESARQRARLRAIADRLETLNSAIDGVDDGDSIADRA